MHPNQNNFKNSNYFYISLLLLISILGYWQISFLKYSVTHDMINCWIPWRYHISECIQNHIFPFWNPYQQLGYPIHADLQGPTWYIESLLMSMTVGQNNITTQLLFIFYVFIAGVGMYFLSLCFQNKKSIAFIIGASYLLSGFFVSHVQHFYSIISAAWLPFIILNYYKMHSQKSFLHALYASIFMFFTLTGGNHTFTIILVYFLVLIFIYFVYTAFKEKSKQEIIQYFKINFLFIFCTLLMSTIVIVIFFQTVGYIDRFGGMIYIISAQNPLSPQSLLSLLLPFSTVNSGDFFNTDRAMPDIYFGIIILIFVLLFFVSKKSKFEKLVLAFAILCLIASFGNYTPFHKFIFDTLPLLNLFRFPAYYSLFTIVICLLLAGNILEKSLEAFENYRKKILIISTIITLLIIGIGIIAILKNQGKSLFFLNKFENIFAFVEASSLYQNIILHSIIQVIFLVIFILATIFFKKKYWLKIIGSLVIVNLFIATQLSIANVGISSSSPLELTDYLKTLPHGFPIPEKNKIIDNTESLGQKHGLYLNTSLFGKRISFEGFNSYVFKNYFTFLYKYPHLYKSALANQLVYYSDKICFEEQLINLDTNKYSNKILLFSDFDYKYLKIKVDTLHANEIEDIIRITSFNPNEIKIHCFSKKRQMINLLQSYYEGWEATIDGEPTKIYVSNFLTMAILVDGGDHEVIFKYKNPTIILAGLTSYLTFFMILIYVANFWWKKNQFKVLTMMIFGGLILVVLNYFIFI